jgi:hypothetical protein
VGGATAILLCAFDNFVVMSIGASLRGRDAPVRVLASLRKAGLPDRSERLSFRRLLWQRRACIRRFGASGASDQRVRATSAVGLFDPGMPTNVGGRRNAQAHGQGQ